MLFRSDMNYEFMTNLEFCRGIKAACSKAKLVMLAESLQATDEATAKTAGADGFVVKTNECELLIKAISKLVFATPSGAGDGGDVKGES